MQAEPEAPTTAPRGCSRQDAAMRPSSSDRPSTRRSRLEALVPIAVVIGAGCEPCAKRTVEQAIDEGSAILDIRKVLAIVGHMRELKCFEDAIGAGPLTRMDKPLDTANATLNEFAASRED